jgi:F-type H+-transporting ATPase subunit delta
MISAGWQKRPPVKLPDSPAMKINKQTRREAKQLFRACLAGGVLDEGKARQVVKALLEAKPRGYLAILSHFHRLVKLDVDRRTARVESAVPLSEDMQGRLKQSLVNAYGPAVNVNFGHNPALIGGVRVQVGSDVYDGSIRAKLAALEESFS